MKTTELTITSREREMLNRVANGKTIPYNRSVSAVIGSLRRKGLISGRLNARSGAYHVTELGKNIIAP